MATISLCMIVKDEADCLPEFLDRVEDLWDELIVVDSHSTDGSQALIRAAGGTVVDRAWTGDFAAARNAGLEHATSDWIAFFDPDELLDLELVRSLRDLSARPDVGAVAVHMANPLPDGHTRSSRLVRMFRNRPDLRFRHAIHEDITEAVHVFLQTEGLSLRNAEGTVLHTGYVRERAAQKDKKRRDRDILRSCIRDRPDDLYNHTKLLEVAQFWSDADLVEEASTGLWAAVNRRRPTEVAKLHFAPRMLEMLGRAHHLGDLASERSYLEDWLALLPESPELWFRLGMVCETAGAADPARAAYRRCLTLHSDTLEQLVTIRPLLGLARLAMASGDWLAGVGHAEDALNHAPLDREALVAWLVCSLQTGRANVPGTLVKRTLEVSGASAEAMRALAFAMAELGFDGEADALYDQIPDEPVAAQHARHKLALGDLEGARRRLETAGPREPEAQLGLLVCNLLQGRSSELQIELELDEATRELQRWIPFVLRSRDPALPFMFRANASAIEHVFPDLPGWLV